MATDPCVPTDQVAATPVHAVHRAPHHVLGRPRPRLHHSQFHAIPPAHDPGACGKVFANGSSGPLAARPVGAGPVRAGLVKVAGLGGAGKAAVASLAAAALAGGIATLPGVAGNQHTTPAASTQPAGLTSPTGGQSALPSPVVPPGVAGTPPGTTGSPPGVAGPPAPSHPSPGTGTAVPEPASLLLLLAAVAAALAARGFRRKAH